MPGQVTWPERVARERAHGEVILAAGESNWGWSGPAGAIRKQRRACFLAAPFESGRDARVLEVGCGTGTFTRALSRSFPRLTAIDVSEALLAEARRRLPEVPFESQDIHRTSFADATFDLVVGCSVLHHLEWERALREVARILKPGGAIRFSEPNLLNPQIFLQKKWPWLKRRMGDSPDESAFTPRRIARALDAAGFTSIEARPFEFLHPATPEPLIQALIRLEHVLEATPLVYLGGSIRITARRPDAIGSRHRF